MIQGQHSAIRVAEADDADALFRLYQFSDPRSFHLDRRHEVLIPARDELREMLGRKDLLVGSFYAIEDLAGEVRGFAILRGVNPEMLFAEVLLALFDGDDYRTPLAQEALDFLFHQAFVQRSLNKVMAHCLDTESAYRELLVANAFQSNGVQREVVFTQGRWHNLESLTRYREGGFRVSGFGSRVQESGSRDQGSGAGTSDSESSVETSPSCDIEPHPLNHSKPQTPDPKPQTPDPKPETRNPTPAEERYHGAQDQPLSSPRRSR